MLPYVLLAIYQSRAQLNNHISNFLSISRFPPLMKSLDFEHFENGFQLYKMNALYELGVKSISMESLHQGAIMTDNIKKIMCGIF